MAEKYDAIVIGSGLGGSTCAALLAKQVALGQFHHPRTIAGAAFHVDRSQFANQRFVFLHAAGQDHHRSDGGMLAGDGR